MSEYDGRMKNTAHTRRMKGRRRQYYCTVCGANWEGRGASEMAYAHGGSDHDAPALIRQRPGSIKPKPMEELLEQMCKNKT